MRELRELKAYKVEIRPTEEQVLKINKTLGVCRYIYNFYLSHNQEIYKETKKFVSSAEFRKWLNNEFLPSHPEYAWIKEVSSKAVTQAVNNGEKAFKKFFTGKAKFPRYKKRTDYVKAYLPKNNTTDFGVERHRIKVPTLGWLRLKEFGYIPLNADITSATVSRVADRFYLSVLVKEVTVKPKSKSVVTAGIGVDLGIKDFVIVSDGRVFKNINKTAKVKKLEKKLRREQRSLARKLQNKKGESNKRKNQLRVQRLYARLASIRQEYVRFVVNSLVAKNPQFIAIEDLNVKGMLRNRHLSKSIKDSMFSYFREFLIQQAGKYGIEIRIIYRFYPSSKLCRVCGSIKSDLKLSDRIYKCDCGHVEDRDLNASTNIRECKSYKVA